MSKTEITDKFIVTDEQEESYLITEFTHYVSNTVWAGTESWEEDYKRLILDDGSAVNRISDTEFKIVKSGVRLTNQRG
jgi:hypothetical protein